MNRRRKTVRLVSVVSAAGLLTALAAWRLDAKPLVGLGASLLAVFVVYAFMNMPEAYRRHGWGQVEQAVDNDVGKFGKHYPDEPLPPQRVTKVGRNEPCPCGTGLKFKQCCGAG
jgi:hypothetical protein